MKYLVDNDPMVKNMSRSDVQNWVLLSFFTPENDAQSNSLNSINNILNDNVMTKIIEDVTSKFKELIATEFSNKLQSLKNRTMNLNNTLLKENTLQYLNLFNDIQLCSNYKTRYFENDVELLEYKYKNYIFLNSKSLYAEYKSTHGDETCFRGVKVRGIFNNLENAQEVTRNCKEKVTNKYIVPVGKHIPVKLSTVNTINYSIDDDMLNTLNNLIHSIITKKTKSDEDFKNRLQIKNNI